jgi:hypothetical protein
MTGVLLMLPALHCLSHQSIIALCGLVISSCLVTVTGLMPVCGMLKGFITVMVLMPGFASAARSSSALLTASPDTICWVENSL